MAWGKKKNPGYSYFAVGATLEGRLCFTGIIRLDGRVNGEVVSSGTLVVEETAVITGSVLVESIILSGTVYGSITAFKHVQLNASARVYGHINYGELSIEGALHEGSSHKLTPDEIEEAHRECLKIMEDAAAKAEDSKAGQISLAQYAAALDSADKQPAHQSPDRKPAIAASAKKSLLPSGRGKPAPPSKTGEPAAPPRTPKTGEPAAPASPSKTAETQAQAPAAKAGLESSAGRDGNAWFSVKAGGPGQTKDGVAPALKSAASPSGKPSS